MSVPIKILNKGVERLIHLEPYNNIKTKLIIDHAIDETNLMIADEMKNLDETEMKEGKVIIKRLWNDLDEIEINALEKKMIMR